MDLTGCRIFTGKKEGSMVFEPIFCSKPTARRILKRIFFRLIDYAVEREAQREREEEKSDDEDEEEEDDGPVGLEVCYVSF